MRVRAVGVRWSSVSYDLEVNDERERDFSVRLCMGRRVAFGRFGDGYRRRG